MTEKVSEDNVDSVAMTKEVGNSEVNINGHRVDNAEDEEKTEMKAEVEEVSCWDVLKSFLRVLFTVSLHVFDQVTDIVVAVYFYNRLKYLYFGLTMAFVILPSLITTVFSLLWYIQDHKDGTRSRATRLEWTIRAVCLACNFGPILRYFESLYYGCLLLRKDGKANRKAYLTVMVYEDTDASLLCLFGCFLESAPQLVLQIYVLAMNEIPESVEAPLKISLQVLSVVSSLASLAWTIASYNRSLRLSLEEKRKLSSTATVFQFIWRYFIICSRILSLALFATVGSFYIFAVVGAHWLVMTIWIVVQKTEFCDNRSAEFLYDMVMGVVYVFCFINVKEEPTRRKSFAYHVLVFLEGTCLILTWYWTCDSTVWYHLPALVGYFGTFFIGISLMILYYKYLHPTVSMGRQVSVNGDVPDGVEHSSLPKNHHSGSPLKLNRRARIESTSTEETIKL